MTQQIHPATQEPPPPALFTLLPLASLYGKDMPDRCVNAMGLFISITQRGGCETKRVVYLEPRESYSIMQALIPLSFGR